MSERISAEIWIGGQLKREHVEAFCATISGQHIQLEFGGGYVSPATAEHLEEAIEELNGTPVLYFCDEMASWGEFSELEAWLQEHGPIGGEPAAPTVTMASWSSSGLAESL
jgi:hypothetical protein